MSSSAPRQVQVTRRTRFSAATRFGASPQGVRGHDYRVDVVLVGPVDPVSGMVVDLATVNEVLLERVVARYDGQLLDEHPAFAERMPSCENIALQLFDELSASLLDRCGVPVALVRVWENDALYAEAGSAGA